MNRSQRNLTNSSNLRMSVPRQSLPCKFVEIFERKLSKILKPRVSVTTQTTENHIKILNSNSIPSFKQRILRTTQTSRHGLNQNNNFKVSRNQGIQDIKTIDKSSENNNDSGEWVKPVVFLSSLLARNKFEADAKKPPLKLKFMLDNNSSRYQMFTKNNIHTIEIIKKLKKEKMRKLLQTAENNANYSTNPIRCIEVFRAGKEFARSRLKFKPIKLANVIIEDHNYKNTALKQYETLYARNSKPKIKHSSQSKPKLNKSSEKLNTDLWMDQTNIKITRNQSIERGQKNIASYGAKLFSNAKLSKTLQQFAQ